MTIENTINIEDIFNYQQRVHELSYKHGYWQDKPNKNRAEIIMVIISELGGVLSRHLKGDTYEKVDFDEWKDCGPFDKASDSSAFRIWHETYFIPTLEAKVVSVFLKILDYMQAYSEPLYSRECRRVSSGSIGEDLLLLNQFILAAHKQGLFHIDWGYVIALIIKFCEWWKIDIKFFIELQLRYSELK